MMSNIRAYTTTNTAACKDHKTLIKLFTAPPKTGVHPADHRNGNLTRETHQKGESS